MHKYVVIMAGGSGTRFWPRSRKKHPKQLLNIFGENTMIQETIERLDGFVEKNDIFIITNKVQKALIEDQLREIPEENIIAEPAGRNTAPCIGLAAKIIQQKNNNGVIVTLPADHLIKKKELFHITLNQAVDFAFREKCLVTFGINPSRPETGYGYINFSSKVIEDGIFKVNEFVEKPDLKTAKKYISSGDYLWNSGMFVWRADVILHELNKFNSEIVEKLNRIISSNSFRQSMEEIYPSIESISIDYAVMEKSEKVYVIKGDFEWSDVGSWETVYELKNKNKNGNAINGDVFTLKTRDSYIYSPKKFTAVIGENNIVIIETEDALLVCNRENVQDVKEVVNYLKENNRDELI